MRRQLAVALVATEHGALILAPCSRCKCRVCLALAAMLISTSSSIPIGLNVTSGGHGGAQSRVIFVFNNVHIHQQRVL